MGARDRLYGNRILLFVILVNGKYHVLVAWAARDRRMLGASRGKYSRENTNLRHHGGVIDRMSKAAVARLSSDFFALALGAVR